jgi:hypothetical protein
MNAATRLSNGKSWVHRITWFSQLLKQERAFFGRVKVESGLLYGRSSKKDLENLYNLSFKLQIPRKGKIFEDFTAQFFSRIEGFDVVRNIPAYHTEVDILIKNKSTDPYLSKLGEHIIVQCKNVRKPIENSVINSIRDQAKLFGGTCKYAILATTSKLSSSARSELYTVNQQGPPCIIVIDGELWQYYFSNPKTTEKELLEKAIEFVPRKYR